MGDGERSNSGSRDHKNIHRVRDGTGKSRREGLTEPEGGLLGGETGLDQHREAQRAGGRDGCLEMLGGVRDKEGVRAEARALWTAETARTM